MTTSVDCVDDSKTSLSGETLCDGAHTQSYLDDYSDRPHTRRSKSIWSEVVFVVSISISRSLCGYSLIGFPTLLPTLVDKFHLEGTSRIWLASIFPLVLSAFLIPFRRLADRFGVLLVFHLGLAWTLIWTLFAGISTNGSMLIACRAMQGLGGAAHFLSGATILSGIYSPGSRRDRVFFLYESMELLGSFLGILVAGLVSQYLSWRWYFWVAAILALQALVGSALTVPESAKSFSQRAKVPMDWLGCFTTASALILTACWIIEFPDAPQGWRTPYLLATEVLSIVSLGLAVYVEGWIAEKPLLPLRILETSRVGPLLVGLFFGYGAVGLYLLYAILYIRDIMEIGPLELVVWFAPMTIAGCFLAIFKGFFLHAVSSTIVLTLTACAAVVAPLLLALAPLEASYWAYFFPAMLCAAITLDLIFHVFYALLTTALPPPDRSLVGTLANALAQSSIALLLGVAAMVEMLTEHQGKIQSYKNVFWLGTACGSVALLIFVLSARIERAIYLSLIKWIIWVQRRQP